LDRPRRAKIFEPDLPDHITGEELDKATLRELSTLQEANATYVARHLIASGLALEEDPELAWKHARAAAHHAGRIAVVREAAGIAAYHAGHYSEALAELRAATRISGDYSTLPIMADCERGLGRPQKAIDLAGSTYAKKLEINEQIELRIVTAGARRDLGEIDAAIVTLTCAQLREDSEEWSARIRYAYADLLELAGREEEALTWFEKAALSDPEDFTDAKERVKKLQK